MEWRLKAVVSAGQRDPDVEFPRVTRLIPGTEVTVGFGDDRVEGSAGCNRYASQSGSGGYLVNEERLH